MNNRNDRPLEDAARESMRIQNANRSFAITGIYLAAAAFAIYFMFWG